MGRGPLRAVIFRDHDDSSLRCCRHGCAAEETAEHVLLHCPRVQGRRMDLARQLLSMKKNLALRPLLATPEIAEDVEKLLAEFLQLKL